MELITQQAMKAGFTGGVVIDYPNSTKAKKLVVPCALCHPSGIFPIININLLCVNNNPIRIFLCLSTAGASSATLPKVRSPHHVCLLLSAAVYVNITGFGYWGWRKRET